MPKKLAINNIGLKGLNTDLSPWDLPPEFLTFGINFRVYANTLYTTGGYADWSTATTPFFPGYALHVGSTSGDYWLVAGRNDVNSFDGATWTSIGSGAYPGMGLNDELNWTGCFLGQIPIINNPQHVPEYWSPQSPGQPLQPLQWDATTTWAARAISCKVMRSHKNFLFALNIQDGAIDKPDTYRWSTAADINGLPYTWDETDQAGLAGEASLGGDGGVIIDGLSLRDSFVIYSENSIDILDFTGGEFIWKRRELSNTVGLLSKQCIVEVKGTHYFMGDGDILRNDGTTIQSILRGRVQQQFNARLNVDKFDRSFVVRNYSLKEIWFCIPEEDAEYPNVAYIYNWTDDSWAIRDLPENMSYAAYGPEAAPTPSWDSWEGTWDTQTRVWGSRERTPLDDTVVGVINSDSSLKFLEPKDKRDSGPLQTRIERTDFPLEGLNMVTTIVEAFPHMDGTSPVEIQFGSQKIAGGPVTWKPSVTFIPGVDRKVDVRTTGSLHCWRIESETTGNWAFSGMDIFYENAGER
jgi:hypothetical protein